MTFIQLLPFLALALDITVWLYEKRRAENNDI